MRDRTALWPAVELADRHPRAVPAREFRFSLPAGVPVEGRIAIAMAFTSKVVERFGVAADLVVHPPPEGGDSRNWHAHLLVSTRAVDPTRPNGLGKKVRDLDPISRLRRKLPNLVSEMRDLLARFINSTLEKNAIDERVDPRSYKAQGLDFTPQPHLGQPATAMTRKGMPTAIAAMRDMVRVENAGIARFDSEIMALEAELAILVEQRNGLAEVSQGVRSDWSQW
jgi:hypothetical protein